MSYIQHHFNVEIAQKYGVNVAIFLDHMVFWVTKNLANNHNIHDGACWTRNTTESYTVIFPYWTAKQIRKVIADCKKHSLINVNSYNKTKYDQTKWYSLTEYAAKLLNISIFPKGQMDVPEKANGFSQKGRPIPITNTVTNTERESTPREKRVALSDSFSFSNENQKLCQERGVEAKACEEKFKAYALAKKIKSDDWQAEAKLWILREKVTVNELNYKNKPNETKSSLKFWEPGNPDYDRVNSVSV